MKKSNKGFTLMEMLIVVAIIAVLVAIAIPTFSGALTKAKEAADEANVRAAYAEAVVANLTENTPFPESYNGSATLNYSSKLDWEVDATTKVLTIVYDAEKISDLSLTANPFSVE